MKDAYKPKEQLLEELEDLRRRLAGFQTSEARDAWSAVESALRESEERYRELFENAHDVVYTHDLTGRFTSINKSAETITGYSRVEALQMTMAQIVAPEYMHVMRQMLDPTAGARSRHELEIIAKDGRRVAVEINTRFVMQGERLVGVQGIARDITDRKQVEEALRIQHEQQQTVLDSVPAMMVYTDVGGRVLRINKAAASLFNRPVSELEGRSIEIVSGPLAAVLLADYPAVIDMQRPMAGVMREVAHNGERRWLRMDTVPHSNDSGQVIAIIVFAVDVTEQKRAEQALRASETQFRALFELAPIGITRIDVHGRIIDCNRVAEEMFGYSLVEVQGKPFSILSHLDEIEDLTLRFNELVTGVRQRHEAELRFYRKDGTLIWANMSASIVRDAAGSPLFCIAAIENVSDRKRAEEALRQSNQRLSGWVTELEERNREISLLSEMGDMLQACRSIDEAHAVIARMARQLFVSDNGYVCVIGPGYSNLVEAVAVWGTPAGERFFNPDECWALRRGRVHLVQDPQLGLICKHMHRPADSAYLCVPMMAQGEALGLLHLSLPTHARLSEAKQRLAMTVAEHIALSLANLKLQETLRSQSIRDPLTGLFNRRYMEESLEREMRRAVRGRHPVGIIMLDLDHFKQFNDAFGHEAGDTLLREVGTVLQRSIRGEDIACRYGGEEFTLILPEVSLLDAAQRAEHIRDAFRGLSIQHRRQQLGTVTVSLGVAIYPDHGPTGDAVIRAADAALYQAKALGRDRVAVNSGGSAGIGSIEDLTRT